MSDTNEKQSATDKSAAKRAAVLEEKKSSKGMAMVVGLAVALLAVGGLLYFRGASPVATAQASTAVATTNGAIRLTAADFDDAKAKFYSYSDNSGPTIKYFVVKGPDGKLHSAFDACDACWSEGKGYKQSGDVMVCQNCRRNFAINKIGEIHGGCNPSPLKHRIENGKLIIETADILAGRHYFDLPKRN